MTKIYNRRFWLVGLIVAATTFILLIVGVKVILNNNITTRNILAFIILAVLYGVLTSALYYFNMGIAFVMFCIGISIGFFEMYRMFLNGMSGWGDLVGIISLFTWSLIGLSLGLITQLAIYIYYKFIDKKK